MSQIILHVRVYIIPVAEATSEPNLEVLPLTKISERLVNSFS